MTSIPNELINEIFSRLPSKSIARFRCVSKLWCSMFQSPYFTELFLARSSARPRLLFALGRSDGELKVFSLPHPQNPYGNSSSLVVAAADFHMTFFPCSLEFSCGYASGLICSSQTLVVSKEEDEDSVHVICSPSTGKYTILPKVRKLRLTKSLLGFDPIDKQYKLLSIDFTSFDEIGDQYRILTLETGNMSWREIQCPVSHNLLSEGICIKGVLYYLANLVEEISCMMIVCFDVRSEKFKFIDIEVSFYDWPERFENINYKGKFGWISLEYDAAKEAYEMCMWVLADVEKRELSKHVYTLPDDDIKIVNGCYLIVVGVTATGEIVLSTYCTYKPFYVFYFNPERNTFQTVEIHGFGEYLGKVDVFVDYVEDLNDAKLLKSGIYVPSVKNKAKPHHRDSGIGKRKGQR